MAEPAEQRTRVLPRNGSKVQTEGDPPLRMHPKQQLFKQISERHHHREMKCQRMKPQCLFFSLVFRPKKLKKT